MSVIKLCVSVLHVSDRGQDMSLSMKTRRVYAFKVTKLITHIDIICFSILNFNWTLFLYLY